MKKFSFKSKLLYLVIISISLLSSNLGHALKVYEVSPDGVGIHSLLGAKEDIRKNRNSMNEDVIVIIEDGYYQLNSTLTFDALDGGSDSFSVTYKAAPGATPVLSGGHRIINWITDVQNSIMKTSIENNSNIRNLYVNGERMRRSHSKEVLSSGIYRNDDCNVYGLLFNKTNIPDFKKVDGLEISYKTYWRHYYFIVDSIVDNKTFKDIPEDKNLVVIRNFDLALNQNPKLIETGTDVRYTFENAIELVNDNDDWCFVPSDQTLYNFQSIPENPYEKEYIVGDLECLLSIRSSVPEEHVKNLFFEGLSFCFSSYSYPSLGGFFPQQSSYLVSTLDRTISRTMIPGAIQIEDAENIVFRMCMFKHIGSNGICINNNTDGIHIEDNVFEDISGSAIRISDNKHISYNEDIKPTANTIIKNNLLKQIGAEFSSNCGIDAYYVENLTIENNELYDMPYSGISVGFGWTMDPATTKDVRILNNKIIGDTQKCHDGAGIYSLGYFGGDGLLVEGNYIDEITNKPCNDSQGALYMDQGSSNVRLNNNVVESERNWFFFHQAGKVEVDSVYVLSENHNKYGGIDAVSGGTEVSYIENGNNIFDLPNDLADMIVTNAGIQKQNTPNRITQVTEKKDNLFELKIISDEIRIVPNERLQEKTYTICLYGIDGTLKRLSKSHITEQTNINGIAKGLYIIEIIYGNQRFTQKIIV